MRILVSFVNQFLTPDLKLGVLDTETEQFSWICNGIESLGEGATGLLCFNDRIYVCLQQSKLAVFNFNFEIVQLYDFSFVMDAHSLVSFADDIYVVSSGTNECYKLTLDRNGGIATETLFWQVEGVPDYWVDYVHLNSICSLNGEMYVTMFGRKDDSNAWRDRGVVASMIKGDIVTGIKQPHTGYVLDDELVYCESSMGVLRNVRGDVLARVEGYSRGVAECENNIYLGSSARRVFSKSKKKFLKGRIGVKEDSNASCYISVVSKESLSYVKSIDLSDFANEIYDLYILPDDVKIDFELDRLQTLRNIKRSTQESVLEKMREFEITLDSVESENQLLMRSLDISKRNCIELEALVREKEDEIEGQSEKLEQILEHIRNLTSRGRIKDIPKRYRAFRQLLEVVYDSND